MTSLSLLVQYFIRRADKIAFALHTMRHYCMFEVSNLISSQLTAPLSLSSNFATKCFGDGGQRCLGAPAEQAFGARLTPGTIY